MPVYRAQWCLHVNTVNEHMLPLEKETFHHHRLHGELALDAGGIMEAGFVGGTCDMFPQHHWLAFAL